LAGVGLSGISERVPPLCLNAECDDWGALAKELTVSKPNTTVIGDVKC